MKILLCLVSLIHSWNCCFGQNIKANWPLIAPADPLPQALTGKELNNLTTSVDRGLKALAKLQLKDGSFPTTAPAKPAVTSFAIMAFLSRGHKPGEGLYGKQIDKAINYVLSIQKKSGIFADKEVNYSLINVKLSSAEIASREGTAKSYCHAICMLMLGEVYGLTEPQRAFRLKSAIIKGLKFSLQLWDIRKKAAKDDGGFRYVRPHSTKDSDMSVTGWYVSSFRSIRNAGFDIPQKMMTRIAEYVLRTQTPQGCFLYAAGEPKTNFAMTAAGTLCIALAGKHKHPTLKKASLFLSKFRADSPQSFFSELTSGYKYPYYTCYYVTQASFQMGGQLWVRCMKECYLYLLPKQLPSGLWPKIERSAMFGTAYSTSLAILALTPPLQLLPIYQR